MTKPSQCPFCDSTRVHTVRTTTDPEPLFTVHCQHCDAHGPVKPSTYTAEQAWEWAKRPEE